MTRSASHDLIVGTFNSPHLFTLTFTPSPSSPLTGKLEIKKRHSAIGSHSWLHLSSSKRYLYATAWTDPPTVASYAIDSPKSIRLLNTAETHSRSGYICASETHAYSAGGATGEVFAIDPKTGAFANPSSIPSQNLGIHHQQNGHRSKIETGITPVQRLDFVSDQPQQDNGSTMDFGGLRHGAHSADLSPDGKLLYIADIGRNCIWVYAVDDGSSNSASPNLTLLEKHVSPRSHDGPRHVHPHPAGNVVYSLQEHSSVVDVFRVKTSSAHTSTANHDRDRINSFTNGATLNGEKATSKPRALEHIQGVRIIPPSLPIDAFWADEVRTSSLPSPERPKYLYASTRGLEPGRKGYVAVYQLDNSSPSIPASASPSNGSAEHEHTVGTIHGAEFISPITTQDAIAIASTNTDRIQAGTDQGGLLYLYETPTSGGWANAIQPGPTVTFPRAATPRPTSSEVALEVEVQVEAEPPVAATPEEKVEEEQHAVEYLAMTDSEVGYVFVLAWNTETKEMSEVARVDLNSYSPGSSSDSHSGSNSGAGSGSSSGYEEGGITTGSTTTVREGAATAVWLS